MREETTVRLVDTNAGRWPLERFAEKMHLRLPPLPGIREALSSRSDRGYDSAVQLINHCVPNLSTSEPK
jgi:hypothetical protein